MKITFLGTGTSTGNPMLLCSCKVCTSTDPRDTRLRSSILIEEGDTALLVDCGPDFRQQALRTPVRHLSAVLLTHEHYDHVGGLDDLRPFCLVEEMPVYAYQRVLDQLRVTMPYSFLEKPYPGVPLFSLRPVKTTSFNVGSLNIEPIRVFHHKLPVLGIRIGDMAYLTDFNSIADSELEKLKGIRLLIVDALRPEPHLSHNTLGQALELIETLKPDASYLIHMSHHMGLHAEMESSLPFGVRFAYDGLRLTL